MPDAQAPHLSVLPVGSMEYGRCLELQNQLHAKVVAGSRENFVVLVEHPPVLTFGKHADKANLLFAANYFRELGIGLYDIDRGGDVTAHEPGQLVVYPVLRLADFGLAPRRYVELLEGAVIRTLAAFGISAAVDPAHPGVWVGREKVCAVGVRVKERATLHGLALNVSNTLDLFRKIVPCGIQGRGVTSLSRLVGHMVTVDEVTPLLMAELARGLGVDSGAIRMLAGLQWEDGAFTI